MIGISKLYCGTVEASDPIRYGRESKKLPSHLLQFSVDKKPVVVWNVTRRCNLKCLHCYAQATVEGAPDELSTQEGMALLEDLAAFGAPVILFSGGEPLMRPDLTELIKKAVSLGMRAVISTNGTLITQAKAEELKDLGLSYVGISLDGMEEVNDRFRKVKGAFRQALAGVENCQAVGLKVGLRFTLNRYNINEVDGLFDLMWEHRIPRICFYHLVYAGRGSELIKDALQPEETRAAVDRILERTKELHAKGHKAEVLTVDNHCDGPYVYLRLLQENPKRAEEVLQLLQWNEGNNTGRGYRLRLLGRGSLPRPVLAPRDPGQCAGKALLPDLDRSGGKTPDRPEEKKGAPDRTLRQVQVAGRVQRQLPGQGRGHDRRFVGPGPGLLPHR